MRNGQDGRAGGTLAEHRADAAKQSGRAVVPVVSAPRRFASLVEATSGSENWRVMFSEREGQELLETIKKVNATIAAATALVGPEGGWADEEIRQARDAGWDIVTLGGRTLRAETAAIAVTALLQHLLGDLR